VVLVAKSSSVFPLPSNNTLLHLQGEETQMVSASCSLRSLKHKLRSPGRGMKVSRTSLPTPRPLSPGARENVYLRTRRAAVSLMMSVARTRPTQLAAPVPKGAEALALSTNSGDEVHLSGMNSRARTKQSSPIQRNGSNSFSKPIL